EPGVLDGLDAVAIVKELAKIESICAAATAKVARRIDRSNVWRAKGYRSAAHLLAFVTGTSVGSATAKLQTAERLEDLPATAQEFSTGRLSQAKVHEIAAAAAEVPEMEADLLLAAPDETFAATRDRSRRVKASGTDELERHRRAHAARSVRSWTDAEGAWQLHASGTPTDGARIMAVLDTETEAVLREARRAGARESTDASRFDALVRLADQHATREPGTGPRAHLFVNVDAASLTRGHAGPGGRCEIKGVGSVPVARPRAQKGDALLTILVKHGVDVTTIAHDGTTTMPASIRRTVLARDPECVTDTCTAPTTAVHHVRWRSDGGEHSTHNCRGLCRWCHALVHYHGYTLEPNGDGTYHLRAPPAEAAA
ncbi:MAG: DUF222 domain-containing protein, partial [Acidimicrobiia bacterium]